MILPLIRNTTCGVGRKSRATLRRGVPFPTAAPAGGTLHASIVVVPPAVKQGEKATLYAAVTDQANNQVEGVKVIVTAGGWMPASA
jgi:hypothetical protein